MASSTLTAAASLAARGSGGRSSVSGIAATVFGSTGFLGRYVTNQLGRIGSQVTVPFRGDELYSRHLKVMGDLGQIVPVPFELRDEDSVRDAIRGSGVVINLIGKHFETLNYKFSDVHVGSTKRLAEIAREEGIEHFVHVSTVPTLKECASEWLKTKMEGEQVIKEVYPHATIVRPADMFGAEDRLLTRMANNVMQLPFIPTADDGESRIQPVWVNDVASVVVAAARDPERFVGKTVELAGPEVMTVMDLYTSVCTKTKREARFVPVPAALMQVGARMASMRLPVVNPYPLYTADSVMVETAERILDTEKEGVMRFEDLDCFAISIHSDIGTEVLRRFRRGGDRSSLFYVD
eukprot:GFKZ01014017.1.p2 GENE.GFKZ01014017.1~~GFKZ01014017.1.p2  ORF type:complete len:351 (+),score=49.71 GFKZ01014017.1:72-1124(+)